MIPIGLYESAIFDTIKNGATVISDDVRASFHRGIEKYASATSRLGLEKTLKSIELSVRKNNPACPDTGWPLFYYKIGNDCLIEGGIIELEAATRRAVAKATGQGYLRATMKHPLTGYDPGNNIGENIPYFTYKFVSGSNLELTYVAKGGGSECFGGTRYRMIAFADGTAGIKKFILDSYIDATRSGGICPPSILGIGIGGTMNIAASLAKEASCLRIIGSKHPEPMIAALEESIFKAINSLGIGTMGFGGDTSVFGVNVEYAFTHIAGIAVAMSCNCMVARRATSRILANGTVQVLQSPNWFGAR